MNGKELELEDAIRSPKESAPLDIENIEQAIEAIEDLKVYGDGDTFKLICKASSKSQGWMKSTKAMPIPGVGCLVQVTTKNLDNIAEAITFVPGVMLSYVVEGDESQGMKLVKMVK